MRNKKRRCWQKIYFFVVSKITLRHIKINKNYTCHSDVMILQLLTVDIFYLLLLTLISNFFLPFQLTLIVVAIILVFLQGRRRFVFVDNWCWNHHWSETKLPSDVSSYFFYLNNITFLLMLSQYACNCFKNIFFEFPF